MRVHDYTKALAELAHDGMSDTTLFEGLKRVLTKRGHLKLYPKILRQCRAVFEKERRRNTVTVVLARPEDRTRFEAHIARARARIPGDTVTEEIDETITGGYIIRNRTQKFDASYKKSLLALYRSLTKA